MARILGLDLGSDSVKAVLLESAMRGYVLKGFAQVARPEGDRLPSLAAAAAQIVSEKHWQADQVVVALPGQSLATHLLTLPFTDPKRIESTLPYEIESQLPFDLSVAVFDYQIASQKDKKSDLLVGVVRKDDLSSLLTSLQEKKVDPRVVTHSALAYHHLFSLLGAFGEAADQTIAVVDVGHERTAVAIGQSGQGVDFARTFSGGGADLTRAIAREFQTPESDARALKEQQGAVGTAAVGPDAERLAGALLRGFLPVTRELRSTFKSYSARARRPVQQVILCGGTAKLPGLDQQLSQDLGIPVKVLQLPPEAAASGQNVDSPLAAQAYALALRGLSSARNTPRFNLRRGDFAFKGDFDYVREKVGRLFAFGMIVFVLAIASMVVQGQLLKRREKKVDDLLCETTQKILGRCEKNYDVALNLLRGKESPSAAIPKMSAVNVLAEVVNRLPADVPLTFDQMVIDLDRITMRCETDTPQQIEKVKTALATYKCFREVKEGKVEKSRDGQKTSFRLDIQVDCADTVVAGKP